jgi:hypothetical protein
VQVTGCRFQILVEKTFVFGLVHRGLVDFHVLR